MPGWDTETYPNEIAYRVKDPARFDRVRSIDVAGAKGVRMLYGRIKGSEDWEVQALRFNKDDWTLKEAKAWLGDHKTLVDKKNTNVKVNMAKWEDHGDHVSFPCSFAASGVMNEGLRTIDETRKMVPFCNSMRVIIGHPPLNATGQMAALDLRDSAFPVVGWTSNAREDPFGDEVRIVGDLNIYKVDRRGVDRTDLIDGIKHEMVKDVSIGYFFDLVPAVGVHKGMNYNHEERDINPYHLAILIEEEPACPGPICGIGVASQYQSHGGHNMTDDEGTPPAGGNDTRVKKTRDQDISVGDMSLCSLAGANANVKDLIAERDGLKKEVADLKTKVNELQEAKKKGDEAQAELDRQKVEKKKTDLEKLKEAYGEEAFGEIFGEKPEEAGEDLIASHLKVVDKLSANETASETSGAEQTAQASAKAHKILKVPAGTNESEGDGFLPSLYTVPQPVGRQRKVETQ